MEGPPPPGGDQNRAGEMKAVHGVLTSLSVIIVVLRFIARAKGSKHFSWDDWTMLAAVCLTITDFGFTVALTYTGYGRHIYYLHPSQIIHAGRLLFISEFISNLAICVVKLSVALFLLRIGGLRRWLRISLFTTIALLISSTSAFIIVLFVQCRPIAANWDPAAKKTGKCLSSSALADVSYCSAAISVFTDFLCAALPFQIIGDLKMSRRTKIQVIALLCLGSLAMICGIVRTALIKSLDSTGDPTWNLNTLGNWTTAEFCVGIIAGSIPPCRVLVVQMLHKLRGEPPPKENTIGVPNTRSGQSYLLKSLSKITNAFSRNRSRASPEVSGDSKSSKNSQKRYIPMKPWNKELKRPVSQDSSREQILPLHNMPSASLKAGILKTVDVDVGNGGDGGDFATDGLGQPVKKDAAWGR